MGVTATQRESPHLAKAGEKKIISLPIHGNQTVRPGLAARTAKDARLNW
jgi:hypothetical protein